MNARDPLAPAPMQDGVIGADVELGNFVLRHDGARATPTCAEAADALLIEIAGIAARRGRGGAEPGPRERGRKFLPTNGGCVYIDSDHLELCTPEVRRARDFVAAWHAMLAIARRALYAANDRRPQRSAIEVLVNNSDGHGNSYGSHLSVQIPRPLFESLCIRRGWKLGVLAAYQASSIVFTGQGKVGAENGRPWCDYQIAQRADFIECLAHRDTMRARPLCNLRDEPLCGESRAGSAEHRPASRAATARLHCICYDSTLQEVATYLKAGAMQIVLALLANDALDARLALADPVAALLAYSRDPDMTVAAPLADGRRVCAVDLQWLFLECAERALHSGALATVPEADMIITQWSATLTALTHRDLGRLETQLDWVLKRRLIKRALERHGLAWSTPEAKCLDLLYSSLDESEGLYWAAAREGLVQRIVSAGEIDELTREPPPETRAWLRAVLLRSLPRELIEEIDWDRISLRSPHAHDSPHVIPLHETMPPRGATRLTGAE